MKTLYDTFYKNAHTIQIKWRINSVYFFLCTNFVLCGVLFFMCIAI